LLQIPHGLLDMTVSRTKMTELVKVWAVSLDGPNVLGGFAVYMGML